MDQKYTKAIQIGAVGVFALGLCVLGISQNNQQVRADKTEKNVTLSAGVTKALDTENIYAVSLNSGISALLKDFDLANDLVAVSESSAETVASGQSEDETAICGFSNLGIAVVSSTLNIRESASADSEVVGKMTNHAACEILGTEGEWTQITSGKVNGYVKSEYLITGDEAKAIGEAEKHLVATVNTTTLKVRTEASTECDVITLVADGEDITALGQAVDGWVQVEVDDVQGYVSADYVSLSEKLPTAQSITELKYGSGVSDVRVSLVAYACQFIGNPYVWGGTSLTRGADCSGFTMSVFANYGISLPHSSKAQPSYGTKISASEAKPGDLFFYGSGKSISHVAIYIGNGQIVHASNKKTGIKISSAYYRKPICVVNILGN